MQVQLKVMQTAHDVLVVSKNTSLRPAEKRHRLKHCSELPADQQKMCKYILGKLMREGKVNYMTLEGMKAQQDVCELQHDIASCRKECKMTKEFFPEPTAATCEKVFPEWRKECLARASGELKYEGPSHEEIEQAAKHREGIFACRKSGNKVLEKCHKEYLALIEKIDEEDGRVAKQVNKDASTCFYNVSKELAKCVSEVPEAPEGMKWTRGDELSLKDLFQSIGKVGKKIKEMGLMPQDMQ